MYLRSLTLRGFKSFASRTSCDFSTGINAIVGPNGSGKSNVVDAIAWVLGEQGAKALRGASMSDVIFSGTKTKPALGRAQVHLVIDNSEGEAGFPAGDLEITRTLFKGGGSEFTLNGQPLRLSDVQDLLAHAGLGAGKHCVVGQGDIDRVIHASAEQRRHLIEESSGIYTFRRRAEKTERKLESMKANLQRLEDLAAELTQQREPLSQQAEQATQAQKIDRNIAALRAEIFFREATGHAERSRGLQNELAVLDQQHREIKIQQAELTQRTQEAEKQRADDVAAIQYRKQQHASLLSLSQSVVGTKRLTEERLRSLTEQQATEQQHQDRENIELDRVEQQLSHTIQQLHAYQEQLKELDKQLTIQRGAVTDSEEKQRASRTRLEDAEKTRAVLGEELTEATAALAAVRAHDMRAERERQELQERSNALSRTVSEFQHHEKELRERQEKAQTDHKKAIHRVQTLHEKRRAHQSQLIEEQKNAHGIQVRIKAAHKQLKEFQTQLPAQLPQHEETPALYSVIHLKDGWEQALATALAPLAEAAVITEFARPKFSALFTPIHQSHRASADLQNSQNTLPLFFWDQLLSIDKTHPKLNEALSTALHSALNQEFQNTVFIADPTEVPVLLQRFPELRIFDKDGICYTAHSISYPQSTATNTLHLTARIHHVQQELNELEEALQHSRQAEKTHQENIASLREEEKEAARQVGITEQKVGEIGAELAQLHYTLGSANSEQERLRKRLAEHQHAAADRHNEITHFIQHLAELREKLNAHNLPELRNETQKIAEALAEAQAELSALQTRKEQVTEQLSSIENTRQALTQRRQNLIQEREHAEHKKQRRTHQLSRLHLLRAQCSHLQQLLSTQTEQLLPPAPQPDSLKKLTQSLKELQNRHVTLTHNAESLQQQRLEHQLALAKIKLEQEALETQTQEQLHSTLAELDRRQELFPPANHELTELIDTTDSVEALQQTLKKYVTQREELGPVNPLALREFTALQQRHTDLDQQIQDLKASRTHLRSLLKDLNTQIQRTFTEAFAQTNQHFARIFTELFPDGEASLTLTDPQHPLTSGIDLHVRPGGKSIKRLSLLSGGERALASFAFLTALFRQNPAPFYVLDEVEAALDDRNLDRIHRIFQELASHSQLLIITHKPATIELAQQMIGISMNAGISTVIHQDVEELRKLVQPRP